MIYDKRIDGGAGFDWGRVSSDYAKYRDIYPPVFFQPLLDAGLCTAGQHVLDLGTGTGVLPRALAGYGASFVGTDISPEQIEQARWLSEGLPIEYHVASAEALDFPDASFDAVTACQCFFYFDHETVVPRLAHLLKPGGRLAILYMAWLPAEDAIAGASEELILRTGRARGKPAVRSTFPRSPTRISPRRMLVFLLSMCPSPVKAGRDASAPAGVWALPCRPMYSRPLRMSTAPCLQKSRPSALPSSITGLTPFYVSAHKLFRKEDFS